MHPTSSRSIRTAPPTSDDKNIIISHHPDSDFQQLTRGSLCSNPNLQIILWHWIGIKFPCWWPYNTMGTTDFTEPLINGEQRRLASDSALVIPEAYAAVNPEGHDPRGTGVKRWAWGEIREQCWLSAPIMAMYMLQHMVWLSGNLFVGHLGAFPLAAVSLANSFSCITGYYVLVSPNL